MPAPIDLNKAYRIANVEVNPQHNTLTVEGATSRVEPKAMELLNLLVSNHGNVCSKDEILQEIWPNQVVADDAITRLIFVLRNLLGDKAKSPRFISTISKKGYMFLISPSELGKTSVAQTHVKFFVLSLFFLMACSYYFFIHSVDEDFPSISRAIPVTHTEGKEYSFAKSSSYYGYFHRVGNQTRVMIVMGEGQITTLDDNEWQKRSLLALDNFLLYIRFNSNQYQIVRHSLDGKLKVLVESQKPIYSLAFDNNSSNIIFNQYVNNDSTRLFEYSFAQQKVKPFPFVDIEVPNKIYNPLVFHSDGRLLFVGVNSNKPTIYGVDRDNSHFHYQIKGFDKINGVAQGPTDNELFIAGSKQFLQGIWLLKLDSQETKLIYSYPDNEISEISFISESNQLYFSFHKQRVDLSRVTFNGVETSLDSVNSTQTENTARYSDSADKLYFSSNRTGDFELYVFQESTQKSEQLSHLNASEIFHYSFSNDGMKVAIVYSTDHIRLGVIELKTGKLLISKELEELKFPLGWSRDNQNIYVSEHLKNIAMYLYDVETLTIKGEKQHIGLTALELAPDEIMAFDYQTEQFVGYNFSTDRIYALSNQVRDHMSLAPNKAFVTSDNAMLYYQNGMQKFIYRLNLSKEQSKWEETLVAQLLLTGNIRTFSPDLKSMVVSNSQIEQGDIVKLKIDK